MSTRVLLIRHGATDPMEIRLNGRMPNIPLNALGLRQVEALAERLNRIPVNRLVSSPIQRTLESAEVLYRFRHYGEYPDSHPAPESMALFTEFDFGSWTGRAFAELRLDPEWKEFNESREKTRAPGGESMRDVQQRAIAGLRQLVREEPDRTVVIVSHADVIRAIVLHVTGTPIGNFWRFQVGPASITEIVCGPEGDERLVRLNDCAHVEHEA